MTVRSFGADDVPAAAAQEAAHQSMPWSEKVFEEELMASGRIYLAVGDDELVGYGGVMIVGDEAHITNLFVAPRSRGRGVGRRLLVGLIQGAVDRGARHLTLEVRPDNEAARALYASVGMAPVGVRTRYYGDEDALIMWAHNIDSPEYRERLAGVEMRDTRYEVRQSHP
jgi:[ribosomal protein S18]-alanine N-acetyltransferase